MNSIPSSGGIEVRFISPYSRLASSSAMSTPSLAAPPLVAIDTAPRANRGAPEGDAAPAAALTGGGLTELDTPGGELTKAALGFTLAAAALGGRLPLGA